MYIVFGNFYDKLVKKKSLKAKNLDYLLRKLRQKAKKIKNKKSTHIHIQFNTQSR